MRESGSSYEQGSEHLNASEHAYFDFDDEEDWPPLPAPSGDLVGICCLLLKEFYICSIKILHFS